MVGRKQKSIHNPDLAFSHKAGSSVMLTQFCTHPKYGVIGFPILYHDGLYFEMARRELEKAQKYHKEIFKKPVGKSNFRLITDNELLANFFIHSQLVVMFSYLALEYFAIFCIQGLKKTDDWKKRKLDQKLKYLIPKELGIEQLPQNLCNDFGKLEDRRHLLNHPSPKSIHNGSETEWDTVHLAWFMAGNYEDVFDVAIKIKDYIKEPFKNYMKEKNKGAGPVTLNISKRGIEFKNPAKKKIDE